MKNNKLMEFEGFRIMDATILNIYLGLKDIIKQ